jgi:hypothetical protein
MESFKFFVTEYWYVWWIISYLILFEYYFRHRPEKEFQFNKKHLPRWLLWTQRINRILLLCSVIFLCRTIIEYWRIWVGIFVLCTIGIIFCFVKVGLTSPDFSQKILSANPSNVFASMGDKNMRKELISIISKHFAQHPYHGIALALLNATAQYSLYLILLSLFASILFWSDSV